MNKDNSEAYTYDAILREKFGDSSENPSQVRISRDTQKTLDRLELNRLVRDRAYARQQG
jgi:hypothetical protein